MSNRPRNYKAMNNVKLLQVLHEFETRGEAWDRALYRHTGDPQYEYSLALSEARSRGYSDNDLRAKMLTY